MILLLSVSNVLGNKWQSVTGRLKEISVGLGGVWGLSPSSEVMYRDGTWLLAGEGEGTGWTKVDGVMQAIWSCEGGVWAVSEDGALWLRRNVSQVTPLGTHWSRIQVRTILSPVLLLLSPDSTGGRLEEDNAGGRHSLGTGQW